VQHAHHRRADRSEAGETQLERLDHDRVTEKCGC
jgi:hypothetical protein